VARHARIHLAGAAPLAQEVSMVARPAWLDAALSFYAAGRIGDVERICEQVLASNPVDPDALHLFGLVHASRQKYEGAGEFILRAAAIRPRRGDFYASLGNLYFAKGQANEMIECYKRALLFAYFHDVPAPFAQIAVHAGSDPPGTAFGDDPASYKSQCAQDIVLDRWLFDGMTGGVFVDVGAHDGITGSNSYFFETVRHWRGICIEPNPNVYAKLVENRSCILRNCCISDRGGIVPFLKVSGYAEMLSGIVDKYDPQHRLRVQEELRQFGGSSEVIPVEARGLNEIARECGFGEITYLSIDTEGSELSILRSVDFSALMVHVLTVEFNYEHVKPHMIALMRDRGFDYAQQLGYDLIFINRNSPYRETFARLQGTS
jgi:FkbM family methyltransferase